MEISKKAVALTALAFGLLLPAAPAFAQESSDDYVGGNPPCIPGDPTSGSGVDADGNGTPDECEETDEGPCVPGVPTSGSGVDSDGDGTPDECDTTTPCEPGNPDSGSGVDTDGNGTPDECEETSIDTGAPGGGDVESGEATTGGAGSAQPVPSEGEVLAEGATAPSGSLPVTGGDVVGLAAIGALAVATGTVLVRRSRRTTAS